jgi:hypothetical protein
MQRDFEVSSFDTAGFLAACRSAGIKLSCEVEGETIDGYITIASGLLSVHLNTIDEDKMDDIAVQVEIYKG